MRDDEDNFATEPPAPEAPTGPRHRPPLYTGEPPRDVLTRIHDILTSPDGTLSELRRDLSALRNIVDRRQRRDEQNWEFVKREVSRACVGVDRVEAKLDKIDQRVAELERRSEDYAKRLDAIEARLASDPSLPTPS